MLFDAYARQGVRDPDRSLAEMVAALSALPLLFHPGQRWEYSMATDVIGRLVEVLAGERLDGFFRRRIFEPLRMVDTGFVVAPHKADRLVACYAGASNDDPWKPGLTRSDDVPYPGAYLRPFARQAAGGGLVSTLPDMIALLRSLLPGGAALLKPSTISLMMTNQLPPGQVVRFPGIPTPGKGFGLAGAVTLRPLPDEPPEAVGELEWGGIAGTHWWVSPVNNLAGVVMAQRQGGFWHPFSREIKRLAYRAALRSGD
jgi:CubicO group peptidase (beta-lactamase class C family)